MNEAENAQADFTVRAEDAVAAGFCVIPGLRDYLKSKGYDLREAVRNGIPASALRGFNDAQADRVLKKAEERIRGH